MLPRRSHISSGVYECLAGWKNRYSFAHGNSSVTIKTSVYETYKARMPWLLLLMISATFTGAIISNLEEKLVAFAGVDVPPYQSGQFEAKDRHITKRGSSDLRKNLYQVIGCLMQHSMEKDPVYRFVAYKKAEGKHFYSYMVAGCNKFLRIYYARVKAYLNCLEQQEPDSLVDGSGGSEVVLQSLDC